MSRVYLAEHVVLGKKVALKLLARQLADDESFRERFLRESRVAAAMDHPHIVDIYDAGEADGRLFIAMRYIGGSDLRSLIKEQGAVPRERAVSILGQVALALDAAHARGLVHRDVKPGNILLGSNDHVYLADFGVAKLTADPRGLTRTGYFVGTIDYAAPEQIRGEHVDARADVYSFGCLLYQCLTGDLPFARDSDVQLMFAHLEAPPPSLSRHGFPAALDSLIAKAMAKQPADRYATCSEVVGAVRSGLNSSRPEVPRSPGAPLQPPPAASATTIDRRPDFVPPPPAPPKRPRRPSQRAVLIAVGATVFLVAIAVLGLAYLREPKLLATVTGVVRDGRTGAAARGVTVSTGEQRTVTNAAGRFSFSNLREGRRISLRSCAYEPRDVGASATMRVSLTPVRVSGRFTSDLTGRPVRAVVAGRGRVRAGADGRVALYGSCPGHVVRVTAPGHRPARVKVGPQRRFEAVLAAVSASDAFGSDAGLFEDSRSATSEKYRRNGQFHIVVRRRNWQAVQVANSSVKLLDVEVSVRATKVAGPAESSFGVACRTAADRYYVFEISSEGLFRIERREGNGSRTLRDWTPSPAIRTGSSPNHVVAACGGRRGAATLRLAVNGRELARIREPRGLPAGGVGLVASSYRRPGAHIVFDNFELKRL